MKRKATFEALKNEDITMRPLVLLLALSTKPMHGSAGATPEPVRDTLGKKLRPAQYGGGLDLMSIGEDCPLDVIAVEGCEGQPVSFTPIKGNKGVVYLSTYLNIEFSAETDCPQSNVWKLDNYDHSTGQWFVTTGGVMGDPGRRGVRNWFKIETYENGHKLLYCFDVCLDCKDQCKDTGLYDDNDGNKSLALSDTPLKVHFQ